MFDIVKINGGYYSKVILHYTISSKECSYIEYSCNEMTGGYSLYKYIFFKRVLLNKKRG